MTKQALFKIYCSFVFGQANYQWSAGAFLHGRQYVCGPPLLSCLLGHTQGSTLFVCHDGGAPLMLLLIRVVQKPSFLVNSVYTNNVLNARVHV